MLDHGLEAGTDSTLPRRHEPFKAAGLTDTDMLLLRSCNNINIGIMIAASAYLATHEEWWWSLIFSALALLPLSALMRLTYYRERKRAEQTNHAGPKNAEPDGGGTSEA